MFKTLLLLLVVFSPSTQNCKVYGSNRGVDDDKILLKFFSPSSGLRTAKINPLIRNSDGFFYLLKHNAPGIEMREKEIFLKHVSPIKADKDKAIFEPFDLITKASEVEIPDLFCYFDDASESLTSKELTLTLTKKADRALRRILL